MTRLTIGGIAAGTFTLGLLAGLGLPGALAAARHDQLMAAHMSAMGSMSMTEMRSMGAMPMMDRGSMPMTPGAMMPAGHEAHHASPDPGQ